ncbi:hypothetical protein QGP82_23795 [Leptothoe sp. LEGE 181152]|nr:hypothetical protein [Leptothoe sp. LEGE 181152]
MPLRPSQQQSARQPQQQYRFSSCECAPSTLLLPKGWPELADGNLSGVPQKSPEPTPAIPIEVSKNQPGSVTLVGKPTT